MSTRPFLSDEQVAKARSNPKLFFIGNFIDHSAMTALTLLVVDLFRDSRHAMPTPLTRLYFVVTVGFLSALVKSWAGRRS